MFERVILYNDSHPSSFGFVLFLQQNIMKYKNIKYVANKYDTI